MKKYIFILAATSMVLASCGKNDNSAISDDAMAAIGDINNNVVTEATFADEDEIDSDEHVLNPDQEVEFFTDFDAMGKGTAFKFAQTSWKECTDAISGNFTGYKCASSRGISVILKNFINTHMPTCVNKGLAAQGGGVMADLHIVHAGILGDRNHSPKSMHAENRAIDIKALEVTLKAGGKKTFTFSGTASSKFYTAFRSCWGGIVKTHNGCPLYKGTAGLTGSIGKENKGHQHHMHTSVPYCVGGKYGAYYYQK